MGKQKKKKASLLREMRQLEAAKPPAAGELSASQQRLQARAPEGVRVVPPEAGQLEMSGIIKDFVDPYFEKLRDFQQCSGFLPLAIVAWNMALLPEAKRAREISDFFEVTKPNHDPIEIHSLRQLVEDLIQDKLEYFAEFERMVIDYDFYIADSGEWRLSVVSQYPEPTEDDGEAGASEASGNEAASEIR